MNSAILEAAIYLYVGAFIPPGHVDGHRYSLKSYSICEQLMKSVPDTDPSKRNTKCIVRVDREAPGF